MNCAGPCARRLVAASAWSAVETTNRRLFMMTHARAHARGLCVACYDRALREGTLIDFELKRLTHEDIMDEVEILSRKGEGFTDGQIADRLNIHPVTLDRHLKRSRNV